MSIATSRSLKHVTQHKYLQRRRLRVGHPSRRTVYPTTTKSTNARPNPSETDGEAAAPRKGNCTEQTITLQLANTSFRFECRNRSRHYSTIDSLRSLLAIHHPDGGADQIVGAKCGSGFARLLVLCAWVDGQEGAVYAERGGLRGWENGRGGRVGAIHPREDFGE